MSRMVKGARAGLAVSALALFIAHPALATEIHTHTPEVHVPTPQIHVPTPQVYVPDVKSPKGGRQTSSGNGKYKGSRRISRDADSDKNSKSGKDTDLPKSQETSGGKPNPPPPPALALPGGIVYPPGVGPNAPAVGVGSGAPAGLYNPNCNGAADCGIVTTPAQSKVNVQALIAAEIAAAFPGTTTCQNATNNPVLGPTGIFETFTIVNSNGQLFVRMGPGGPLYPATVTKNPDGSYTVTWTETAPPTGQGSWTAEPIPPGGNPWSVTLTPTGAGTWSVTPSNANYPVTCTSSN